MEASSNHKKPHRRRRDRIAKITGVGTAINARAARHDATGAYFQADPHGLHGLVEARVLDLVKRCEQYAAATWGHVYDVHIRLDDRKGRSRSRGGLYHSRWRTEKVDRRDDHDRRGGISIAVARRVPLDGVDPFRPGTFREYVHLSPWGDIGTTTAFAPLDVCVAHEVSHAFAYEAPRLLCDRLGLCLTEADEPHGRLFAEVYARLRRHLGLVDATRPEWLALPADARARALRFTRKALPPELAVLAVTDPPAYRRSRRAMRQRQRREEQRGKQAGGAVLLVVNASMEV
jgi:hypothetical protein